MINGFSTTKTITTAWPVHQMQLVKLKASAVCRLYFHDKWIFNNKNNHNSLASAPDSTRDIESFCCL